jgi:hypothetical protein
MNGSNKLMTLFVVMTFKADITQNPIFELFVNHQGNSEIKAELK